jgi:hypothetical protein
MICYLPPVLQIWTIFFPDPDITFTGNIFAEKIRSSKTIYEANS